MGSLSLRPYLNWAPRISTSDLLTDFDRMFEDLNQLTPAYDERQFMTVPAVDVSESEDRYLVSCDLPGMRKEDIKIELHGQTLTVSGERKREAEAQENSDRVHRYERAYGFFRRSFSLPQTMDADKVEASYENGVLEIAIPKSASARPHRIEIQSSKNSGLMSKILNGSKKNNEERRSKAEEKAGTPSN